LTIIHEVRGSDSPYVEAITHGWTAEAGSSIRPAETHAHMVIVKHHGQTQALVVGALSKAGVASWGAGAEIMWIKFKLGTFLPPLPARSLLDSELTLPNGAGESFWLHGETWQFPDHENVDTFLARLVRAGALAHDPVVEAVLQGQPQQVSPRTVRHRFLQATGVTQNHIYQLGRATRAAALLRQGVSILDTVDEAGYFDQPHLTRALKQWIGYTPAQLLRIGDSA
jgi:AraC-like DNA-binding protein